MRNRNILFLPGDFLNEADDLAGENDREQRKSDAPYGDVAER